MPPSGFDIAEAGFCIVEKTENQEPVFPEWVENGENSAYHACEAHDGNLSLLAKNFEVSKQYSVVAYFRYRYAGSTGDYTVIRTQTYQTVTVRPSSPSYNIGGTVPNFSVEPGTREIICTFQVAPAPNEYSELRQCGFCYSTTVAVPTYDAEGCEYVVAHKVDENTYMAYVSKDDTGEGIVYIRSYAIFKDKNSAQRVTVYGEPKNCAYEEE